MPTPTLLMQISQYIVVNGKTNKQSELQRRHDTTIHFGLNFLKTIGARMLPMAFPAYTNDPSKPS